MTRPPGCVAMGKGLVGEVEIGDHFGHCDQKVVKFKISALRKKTTSKTSTLDMERTFRLPGELVSKVPTMETGNGKHSNFQEA